MNLLRKVRVLAGALVHKPFMPRPEKADLEDKGEGLPPGEKARKAQSLAVPEAQALESERVADLIAQKKDT